MRIYQPVSGVGTALRENSYAIISDVGATIGQGGLDFKLEKMVYPDRPLTITMNMDGDSTVRDTLFGALMARAENIKKEQGNYPARLTARCAVDNREWYDYFTNLGFDDYNGLELFALRVPENRTRRKYYSPVGTKSIDVDLKNRIRREEYLMALRELGSDGHSEEWLEDRMRGFVFIAKSVYYGSELAGSILITGNQREAYLDMVGVQPKWRGKGVATSLIDEATMQLVRQKIPYLVARAERRNKNAVKLFKRCEFDWIRTEELLLGRNL